MKINRLETHDRLLHFKKDQSQVIAEGADECLKRNPLSLALQARSPYVYLFAHARTQEDGVTKKMLWQPRLGKPKCEPNSCLFRALSHTDNLEICWILPDQIFWSQYKKGNVLEHSMVIWSIDMYRNSKPTLEKPFADDLPQHRIDQILLDIAREMEEEIRIKKRHVTPISSEPFQQIYSD